MAQITLKINCNISGERIDVFLSDNLPEISRTAVQKLIENGAVTVGGVPVRKGHKTIEGNIYIVTQCEPEVSAVIAQNIPLDVVFEDEDVIVINKPKGMVVHPAPGHADNTLVNALLYHCGNSLSGIGGVIRPGIVHRIDKDTSGLIIAAKNDAAHISLTAQLSERSITRKYSAIVCGVLKSDRGTVDAPIGRHPTNRKKQTVALPNMISTTSRPAITHYEVVSRFGENDNRGGYTHVACKLETGRTHQIRVHMAHINHPILGDMVYGRKKPELGMSGQCLHSQMLRFTHPRINTPVELVAPLPDYFENLLTKLGKVHG